MTSQADQQILLGIVDERIRDEISLEQGWKVNKVGGHPSFSPALSSEEIKRFLYSDLVCPVCGSKLVFLSQIYCPLTDSKLDRVLYFFFCGHKCCESPNWFCFRLLSDVVGEEVDQEEVAGDELDWSSRYDDWASDSEANEVVKESSKALVIANEELIGFEPHYVNVEDLAHLMEETMSIKGMPSENSGDIGDGFMNETYEKPDILKNFSNRLSYKFYKHLSKCPQQIIRYSWNGSMLRTTEEEPQIDHCPNCGSQRVFELQFMPALITLLKPVKTIFNLDFETVYVFTCKENCNSDSVVKEEVIVVKDPN